MANGNIAAFGDQWERTQFCHPVADFDLQRAVFCDFDIRLKDKNGSAWVVDSAISCKAVIGFFIQTVVWIFKGGRLITNDSREGDRSRLVFLVLQRGLHMRQDESPFRVHSGRFWVPGSDCDSDRG